ncbi:MAG: ATP-binding cassette domain-containing protein, partial [Bryobacteraceae bacterium]
RLGVSYLEERPMTEMSSGEAWRVVLARALVHEPKALLFDEPSSHLDIAARASLFGDLRALVREGTGLLMVTHHLSDIIPEIDRVILLRDGRVWADGPAASMLSSDSLTALFGAPVTVDRREEHYVAW